MEEARAREAALMRVEIEPMTPHTLKRLVRVSDVRPPNKSAGTPTSPADEPVDASAAENGQIAQAVLYSVL